MQTNTLFQESYLEYVTTRRPRSMTQNARCAMLATPYRDVPAMQCPTDMHRFHYHKAIGPAFYSHTYTARPCQHRHKSVQAALFCKAH
jgi:hypothetical protein